MHSGNITTPFGRRSVTFALVKRQIVSSHTEAKVAVDKWKVYRDICEARETLGLQDRALAVLNALLSFHPDVELKADGMLVVFPSNEQLSMRSHGISSRTLRRNILTLTDAGIIERHDSPNGKRYAHRNRSGSIESAFGFSLQPLVKRAREFSHMAEQVAENRLKLKRRKDELSLCRRDIRKLLSITKASEQQSFEARLSIVLAELPRSANLSQITAVLEQLVQLKVDVVESIENRQKTEFLSGNDGLNVRHKEESESESLPESENEQTLSMQQPNFAHEDLKSPGNKTPSLPLDTLLRACPDITNYGPQGSVSNWHDLTSAASLARSMLGISAATYQRGIAAMGLINASVVIGCMLQKADSLQNPGAYFCDLTKRSERQAFSPVPLVMSLLRALHLQGRTTPMIKPTQPDRWIQS